LQLHYTLSRDTSPALVRHPLIDLLTAVSSQGSISGGARVLKLSYRHVWGELKRWESELGNELLVWEKGQSARLTEFGTKLMWAERQAQARLAPQIEALRAELERSYALAFDDKVHVLTLYASHDEAMLALRDHARHASATAEGLHLDIRFAGSVDAIRALNEGRCVMAGFHTLVGADKKSLTEGAYKHLLQPGLHKIIGFAQRSQGLMVPKGNPMRLGNLRNAMQQNARFATRTLGSGTRVVLDELLAGEGLSARDLGGETFCESSHGAVAQAVASGQCDAGLGIAAAAEAAGLDFVPLAQERYHLVCLKSALNQPGVQTLLQTLQDQVWQDLIARVPGYRTHESGQVLSMRAVLPWWNYRHPKSPSS
jgi:molybdate transport repressor ModE-like protein